MVVEQQVLAAGSAAGKRTDGEYELSLGLSLIGCLDFCRQLSLRDIVNSQAGWHWNIWYRGQIVAFFI